MRPSDSSGMMSSKLVSFLHSLSGKVNKFAYGTSVLYVGAGTELVEAVTVTVVADGVKVLVALTVLVTLTVVAPGQLALLIHPEGQTWLPILHRLGGGSMKQTGSCA